MKKYILFFLGAFLLCLLSFWLYLATAPNLLGPKTEVAQACGRLTVGMAATEAEAIAGAYENMQVQALNEEVLQVSQVKQDWICVCKATLQSDPDASDAQQIASVDRVFCSD